MQTFTSAGDFIVRLDARRDDIAAASALLLQYALPLTLGLAACLVVAPLALYFALSDDLRAVSLSCQLVSAIPKKTPRRATPVRSRPPRLSTAPAAERSESKRQPFAPYASGRLLVHSAFRLDSLSRFRSLGAGAPR
jgi:hypothetical protein